MNTLVIKLNYKPSQGGRVRKKRALSAIAFDASKRLCVWKLKLTE